MQLSDFMNRNGYSIAWLSEAVGVSFQTAWRYLNCHRIPRPRHMAKIVKATGGCVTANDFYAAADDDAVNRKREA